MKNKSTKFKNNTLKQNKALSVLGKAAQGQNFAYKHLSFRIITHLTHNNQYINQSFLAKNKIKSKNKLKKRRKSLKNLTFLFSSFFISYFLRNLVSAGKPLKNPISSIILYIKQIKNFKVDKLWRVFFKFKMQNK